MFPEWSAINAAMPLAKALKAQGYNIVFGVSKHFEKYVLEQGFQVWVMQAVDFCKKFDKETQTRKQSSKRTGWWYNRKRNVQRTILAHHDLLERLRIELKKEKPVLLLADHMNWELTVPFVELGIPQITMNSTCSSIVNTTTPPVFRDALPQNKSNFIYKVKLWFWWRSCMLYPIQTKWIKAFRVLLFLKNDQRRFDYKNMLKNHGVQLKYGEYGYRIDGPEFVLGPASFDFDALSSNTERNYLGFSVDLERKETDFDFSWRKEELPLMYCSLGTYTNKCKFALPFFKTLIAFMHERTDLQLLLHIGKKIKPQDLGVVPTNVHISDFVPQMTVLKQSDILLTHGGFSTVKEAIALRVPMAVFPWSNDGYGNAARVVQHGIGRKAQLKKATKESLCEIVNDLKNNKVYQTSINKLSQATSEEDGMSRAQDFIDEVIKSNPLKSESESEKVTV